MNHGEGDRVRPVVELPIQDVLVVHDYREAEEDPYGDVGVR